MSGVRLPGHSRAFKPTKPGTRRPAPALPAAVVGSAAPAGSAPALAASAPDSSAADGLTAQSRPPSAILPPGVAASDAGQTAPPTLASTTQIPALAPPSAATEIHGIIEHLQTEGQVDTERADALTAPPTTGTRQFVQPSPSFRTPSLSPFPARESSVASSVSRPRTALLQAAAASAAAGASKPSPGRISKRFRAAAEEAAQTTPAPAIDGISPVAQSSMPPPASPAMSTNGLPPTIGRATPALMPNASPASIGLASSVGPVPTPSNNGLPPSLVQANAPSNAEAGPSRRTNYHQIAESLMDELRSTPDPYPGRMSPVDDSETPKRRAPPGQGKARLAKLAREARKAESEARKEERRAQGLPSVSPPPSKKRKLPRRLLGSSTAALSEENVEFETEEEEAARLARKRGPYGSRGRAGTEYDLRRRENRHRTLHSKRLLGTTVSESHPELLDAHPNQMIGAMVDERVMTMRQLATLSAHEGRASARGIALQRFRKEESRRKRKESAQTREAEWKRRQLQRRKLRAEKNAERQRRREEMGQGGEGEEAIRVAVSEDEQDSDETFELEPDRLTPPTTPESQPGDLPLEDVEGEGQEEIGNGEEYERGEEDEEEGEQGGDEGDEPLFLNDETESHGPRLRRRQAAPLVNGETANAERANYADPFSVAALRAAGLQVDDDDERGNGDDEAENGRAGRLDAEGGDNEDDEGDYEIRESELDLDEFRERQEDRRRQVMQGEDGRVVEEEDDETRMINQGTWGKGRQGTKWTDDDTEMFYAALREVGENYSLIKAWFPGRTVYEIKRKAVRENKAHPDRVTEAVLNRRPLDKMFLTKSAGYDQTRPFDREDSLFAEAKLDVDKLRAHTAGLEGEGLDGQGLQRMDPEQAEEKSDDEDQDDKGDD